ncbi:cysteine dioxygenase family protein [Paraburkholderia sp. SARCC-3016]|uniref:cysteine dioxygenase family protein n=1 Tax=Paraburkholderia sp. SARCC-3016 TaxID=3058611 RepID=UPI0028078AC0|nr:cysteine dioxygenase family protein [Paraburkholderia sp. SARCC-3016]MDQ7977873.1 cysteine dioxygenase family protein [Paraburkholderia sp. SARCC-3016]
MSHSNQPLNVDRHGKQAARHTAAATRLALPGDTVARPANAIERLRAVLDAALDLCRDTVDLARDARFARAVRTALVEAAAEPHLLTSAQREGAAEKYQRHLLAADPLGRYAIASLVWMPGQMSPVHAHHTWCGYVVLEGTLSEALYDWNEEEDYAIPVRTQARDRGAVSYARAGRSAIHRLGNASDAPAISVHVYGVPEAEFATRVNDVVRSVAHTPERVQPAMRA